MAKKVINKYTSTSKKNLYTWAGEGEFAQDFVISDKLSSLVFDISSSLESKKGSLVNIFDGSDNAYVRVISAGLVQNTADVTLFSNKIILASVDAATIYGGAVVSNYDPTKAVSLSNLGVSTKHTGYEATVQGGANLEIAGATVTTVYGGGAGYGSVLEGDVNMTFTSTNRVGTVYGGGQKGAVVNGDVNITVSRADATEGGRIGTIYGGGDNATVNGDVTITVQGTNAVSVGTISGSGRGSKARVTGTRTLEIADYSGKFTSNIKDFDVITISGSSSVVLTQNQNKTIQSATYEFVLDNDSIGQTKAMLTWDKSVDIGTMVITIDAEVDAIENGFSKTIYASNQATSDIIDSILVRTKAADGTYVYSSKATSVYTLEFVADTDSKGNAKAKGGKIVLNYVGSNIKMDSSTSEDLVLSEAAEKISINGTSDTTATSSNVVRASVATLGGDDSVSIQTGTVMAGDIELGTGTNTLRVQGNAQMTGSIIVDKNSTNTIYVNGTISQIEGGDKTTNNIIYINTPDAVGYYKYSDKLDVSESIAGSNSSSESSTGSSSTGSSSGSSVYGVSTIGSQSGSSSASESGSSSSSTSEFEQGAATGDQGSDYNALNEEMKFIPQVLAFSSESNDTVILSDVVTDLKGIDFSKGADTLVLNNSIANQDTFKVTYLDGDDVIVANQNGININANNLKLAGSNNVFVVSNGVRANINGVAAIGDFMAQYDGVYLSQNAMAVVNGEAVISSYAGKLNLANLKNDDAAIDTLTIIAVRDGEDAPERIAEYYTAGTGVNATIEATNAQTIELNDGATVNGTIKNAKEVHFEGVAGSDKVTGGEKLYFEDTKLNVDAGSVATVGSIDGLDTAAADSAVDAFENDTDGDHLALGANARVVEIVNNRTIVGKITEAAEFSGNVAFIGEVSAPVTLKDAKVFLSKKADFNTKSKAINFAGTNEIDVNGDQTLNNKKLVFADGATVSFNVLDDAKLTLDGVVNGETYAKEITGVNLGTNSLFAYADTLETASWDKTFATADIDGYTNIIVRKGSTLEDTINFADATGDYNITIEDGVEVTSNAHSGATAIALGKGNDTLTIGKATIDGTIDAQAGGEDVITLNGTTVNTTDTSAGSKTAIALNATTDTLVANGAYLNGDVTGGKYNTISQSTIVGDFTAASSNKDDAAQGAFVKDSSIGSISGGYVNAIEGTVTVGTLKAGEFNVVGENAKASVGAIEGDSASLGVKDGGTLLNESVVMNNQTAKLTVENASLAAAGQNVIQNVDATNAVGSAEVILKGDTAAVNNITQKDVAGDNATSATVNAAEKVDLKYDGTEAYPTALEDVTYAKIDRKVGAVTQATDANTFIGKTELKANGEYETGYHKPAKVTVEGDVSLAYDSVSQTGKTNDVEAGFDYQALGESDITVGASAMTLGNVTQMNKVKDGTNTVNVGINVAEDAESALNVGAMTAEVGAIDQTSYEGTNTVAFDTAAAAQNSDGSINVEKTAALDAAEKITVASVNMKAYAGTNNLDILGNTEVTGDVSVGGVLEGAKYADYTWGDKAANTNTVNIDADTAKVGGKIGLVGIQNELTLNNASFYTGDTTERTVGTQITLAGKTNKVDLDAGVSLENITLADITDYDKVGKEGYDLDLTKEYNNTLTLRGKVTSLELDQLNSNDTINVYGGTIAGNVATNNGDDTITLGFDAAKAAVMGDSTIGGNVVMGTKDAAVGNNTITMSAFDIQDAGGKSVEAHSVSIGGSVEMYAGKKDGVAANNTLTMTGKGFHDENGYGLGGTAKIGGSVTMDAVSFDAAGNVETDSTNVVEMGPMSTIGGDVAMAAFQSNAINVNASQEIVVTDLGDVKAYAEIAGKVTMAADQNTITVKGAQNGHAENVAAGAGAYMNGIKMTNVYKDGTKEYLTGDTASNAITVGEAAVGSELIVGTDAATLADVSMGSVEFKKAGAAGANYVLDAVEVAERGHDLVTYHDDQTAAAESITNSNTITVVGRFAAKNVAQVAKTNAISLAGDGKLGKNLAADEWKATDEVRTATFTATEITQTATEANAVTATATATVNHYETIDDTAVVTKYLEGARFTADKIVQGEVNADSKAYNKILLGVNEDTSSGWYLPSNNTVVSVGTVEQTASGYDTGDVGYGFSNAVAVGGMSSQVVDANNKAYDKYVAFSSVGSVSQTATITAETLNENHWYVNEAYLDKTNVAGSIVQTVKDNTAGNEVGVYGLNMSVAYNQADAAGTLENYDEVTAATVGGDIRQAGTKNVVSLYNTTVAGMVEQIGTRGYTQGGAAFSIKSNSFAATADTTDAAKFVVAGDITAHDVESVKVQGQFNTQNIGTLVQVYNNEAQDADTSAAENSASLTNVSVNAVAQKGSDWLDNKFTLLAAQHKDGDDNTVYGVTKMGTYVGEYANGQAIDKVATYQDVAKVTLGSLDQVGTTNTAALQGVDAGYINQASSENAKNLGGNSLTLANQAAVTETYVQEMYLDETGAEQTKLAKLADSANKYLVSSTGAIIQTSDVQKNYDASVENLIDGQDAVNVTGDITQSATGANAKFANVTNKLDLTADQIKKADLRIQDETVEGTETYLAWESASVAGKVEQTGAANEAKVAGTVSGAVTQTASMLETYGHNGELLGQKVVNLDYGTNAVLVNGVKNDEVTSLDGTEVVQAEEIILGNVGGKITQTVDNAGKADYAADLATTNFVQADKANLSDVEQTLTYGSNDVHIYSDNLAGEAKTLLKAGAIKQTGSNNTVYGDTVATGAIDQTAIAQDGLDTKINNSITLEGDNVDSEVVPATGYSAENPQTIVQKKLQAASAGDITQTVKQNASAEGFTEGYFNSANVNRSVNNAILDNANVGDVTQNGNGYTANYVQYNGEKAEVKTGTLDETTGEMKDIETVESNVNEIGTITQGANGGYENSATVNNAKKAGDVVQNATPVKVFETPAADTTDILISDASNELYMSDVDEAGNVLQTASSVKYTKYEKVGDADPVDLGEFVTTAKNEAFLETANVGNVTQRIQDELGAAAVATGDNKITAIATNLGNVDQDAVKGNNALYATTNTTKDDDQSKTIGKIDQDGLTNIVASGYYYDPITGDKVTSSGDVTTGAITQNANATEFEGEELKNTVTMEGIYINATQPVLQDPTKEYDAETNPYVFEQKYAAATGAESITQTSTSIEFDTELFDADIKEATNEVTLKKADVGAITQSGNAKTTNKVTFTGSEYHEREIELEKDTEGNVTGAHLKDVEPSVMPSTIGAVSQSGVQNTATIKKGSFTTSTVGEGEEAKEVVAGITQVTQTYGTIVTDNMDPEDLNKKVDPTQPLYTTSKYAGSLDNEITLENIAVAGDVQQTVNAEEFETRSYGKEDYDNELISSTTEYVNGTNTFTATTANVGAVTQTGAKANKVTLGTKGDADAAVTTGAISQTAALEGTAGALSNTLEAYIGSEIASIAQTANGEYVTTPGENEGDPEVIVKNTSGTNKVTLQYADVTGTTAQTAAGTKATNTLTATGNVTATVAPKLEDDTKPVGEDNKYVGTNGEYINSIGDVTQTLKSDAAAADYESAYNKITLKEMESAGNIVQDTTYVDTESGKTITTYGVNKFESTVRESVANKVKQYTIAEDGQSYSEAAALKTTIGSVTQTGYQNVTTIDTAKIGAEVTEGEGEAETTTFVYGDITLKATKTGDEIAIGSTNTVTLTNVEVGKVSATSDVIKTTIKDEEITIGAADSTVTLKDVTASNGVVTGDGQDTVTLWADTKTKITGDLDLGGNTYTVTELPTDPKSWLIEVNGEDKLVINNGNLVDLSEANVKGVENVEIHATDTLDVASLETGDVKLDSAIVTLDAQTIDVGKITDTSLTKVTAKADAEGKLTSAVDYTFNDGTAGTAINSIIGSVADGDSIVIGDDVLDGTTKDAFMENVTLTGFEEVTLNKDAVLNNVTWKASSEAEATTKIKIAVGTVDTTGTNIGVLDGYDYASSASFTLEIGGQVATYQGATGGVATYTIGSDEYEYTLSTGVLAKA